MTKLRRTTTLLTFPSTSHHLLLREAHRGRSPAEELAQSDHLLTRSQRSGR